MYSPVVSLEEFVIVDMPALSWKVSTNVELVFDDAEFSSALTFNAK